MTLKEIFSNLFTINIFTRFKNDTEYVLRDDRSDNKGHEKKQLKAQMCPVRIDDADLIKRIYYKK